MSALGSESHRPEVAGARGQIVRAVVECVTLDGRALSAELAEPILDDVSGYVAGQIGGLSGFLRGPYLLALYAFDALAVLRFGRRFVNLPDDQRARWLALWSAAPIPPMRDFVKLMRSCALFAFHDHPRAAAARQQLAAGSGAGAAAGGPGA